MNNPAQNNDQTFNELVQKLFGLIDMGDLSTVQSDAAGLLQQAFDTAEVYLTLTEALQEGARGVIHRDTDLILSLKKDQQLFGKYLIREPKRLFPDAQLELLAIVLSNLFDCASKYSKINRRVYDLNTYLTISANIQNNLNLNEQLQWVIDRCMGAVSASAASVLLLTQDEQNLEFFAVEGEKRSMLSRFVMPADKGIAGNVIKEQQPLIINDCRSSPYFYDQVDSSTGFITRNMIAAPLTADLQVIGVIEVLNKKGGLDFTRGDADLVLNISNEVSLAVRNARIFEYVVSTYCKILQGQSNCEGCRRPLSNWTPCPLCTYKYLGPSH
jgi:GAF domain-containing protein